MSAITVGQALDPLDEAVSEEEKSVLDQVRQAMDPLPFVLDVPFETGYKRYLSSEV